jgi:hypothetical protein
LSGAVAAGCAEAGTAHVNEAASTAGSNAKTSKSDFMMSKSSFINPHRPAQMHGERLAPAPRQTLSTIYFRL